MRLLPSQRAHLYVLERARVVVRDGRVEWISEDGREPRGYNVPIANTSFLMLGPGTSITNEAVRLLRQEGVCLGFCGGGGTPLIAAQDPFPDFISPADEYRDPRFLQAWIAIWADEGRRLGAAKRLMEARLQQIEHCWAGIDFPHPPPTPPGKLERRRIEDGLRRATTTEEVLGQEGAYSRILYAKMARNFDLPAFVRTPGESRDLADPNALLDQGNYLAYGLASVVLWTLGLPASLSALHGKTRRGGLVFDLADVIKDALVMPTAFALAWSGRHAPVSSADARAAFLTSFDNGAALQTLFDTMIDVVDQS